MNSDIELYEILKLCESLGVQQRVEELSAAAGILIASRPRNVLEIGVYGGGSFALWCALSTGRRIGIDSGSIGGPVHERLPQFRARFGEVDLIKGNSHDESTKLEVLNLLGGEPLDFLFID